MFQCFMFVSCQKQPDIFSLGGGGGDDPHINDEFTINLVTLYVCIVIKNHAARLLTLLLQEHGG